MSRLVLVSIISLVAVACAPRIVQAPQPPAASIHGNTLVLSRVWVAGFLASKSSELDVNVETVRLLRTQLRTVPSVRIIDVAPLTIDTAERFLDVAYWRGLGEEHGSPLIVTGSVVLLLAPPAIVQRGPRTVYLPKAGRVLEATVVLIDGRTGMSVSTQKLPARMRYGAGRFTSGLSLYLQLMDRAMPDWFRAIAGASATPARSDQPSPSIN
ncbi:MAG: hypothetical protein ACRD3C_26150 [Vicinamibacterales bacterium]